MRTILLTLLVAALAHAQPYNPVVLWDRSGAGDHSRYGGRIFSLGDQNDDGFADWGVQAEGWGGPGGPSEKCVELFHGGYPPDTIPYMRFVGDSAEDIYLYGGYAIGDINGDGCIDWGLGYGFRDSIDWWFNVYLGGPAADDSADLAIHMPHWTDVVSAIGDFNGDRFDDLYLYDGETGIASVLYGGNPMDTIPDWQMGGTLAFMIGFGDINGDGYSDMLSYNDTPGLNIFEGGAHPDTVPGQVVNGVDGMYKFVVNDLNGDHRDEIIIAGDPDSRLFFGRDSVQATPSYMIRFPCDGYAHQVVGLGDVNHDGYQDFAMLAENCQDSWWGTVSVFLGNRWIQSDPVLTIRGREGSINLVGIYSVAGLGDVNGDSVNDFAIGAFNSDTDGWRGRVVIISGDSTIRVDADKPRAEIPEDLRVIVYPNPFNAEATISLNLPTYCREVELAIYNLLGQEVRGMILNNVIGTTQYYINAAGLSSGIYLLHVRAGSLTSTKKLMIVR